MKTRSHSRRLCRSWPSSRTRGSALVLVLWVMVVLGAVAMPLAYASHLRLQATATLGQGTQALYLARAGVEKAICDLLSLRDSSQAAADYRESDTVPYSNVPLGEGTWTLFAGWDDSQKPVYGIMDESAKINVLTADESVLSQIPGLTAQIVAGILSMRQAGELRCIADLLRIDGVDPELLYGEDLSGNGLGDPTRTAGPDEDQAEAGSEPAEPGVAAYLTCCSVARNVTSDGQKRVNLSSAGKDDLMKAIPTLTSQEADSIVARRGQQAFKSIADLLDVPLAQPGSQAAQGQPGLQSGGALPGAASGLGGSTTQISSGTPGGTGGSPPAGQPGSTQMAFDQNRLKQIADYVCVTNDDTIRGLVNINTAEARVLVCLPGITDAIADRIVQSRERNAGGFKTVADLLDVAGMTADVFKSVCPLVSARSDVFNVRSFGVVHNGEVSRCVEAIIDRSADAVRIVQWRELD